MIYSNMSDRQLNDYIFGLLEMNKEERLATKGRWAERLDLAMALWRDRHPDTRPPAYGMRPPPPCFTGTLPPIYDGEL